MEMPKHWHQTNWLRVILGTSTYEKVAALQDDRRNQFVPDKIHYRTCEVCGYPVTQDQPINRRTGNHAVCDHKLERGNEAESDD